MPFPTLCLTMVKMGNLERDDGMKRLTGAFFCLLAALCLWRGFQFAREQITDITVLESMLTQEDISSQPSEDGEEPVLKL